MRVSARACGLAVSAADAAKLSGRVLSGQLPIAFSRVTLFRAAPRDSSPAVLGTARTAADGSFGTTYTASASRSAVFYVITEYGTLRRGQRSRGIVATIGAPGTSMRGAVRLACSPLFQLAAPPRGPAPAGTLEAVSNIARNLWQHIRKLFALAQSGPKPYRPSLQRSERPDAWTLALRFVGNGTTMSGPGNFAIDAEGNIWVTNNYEYSPNPLTSVCGSDLLLKFRPTRDLLRPTEAHPRI